MSVTQTLFIDNRQAPPEAGFIASIEGLRALAVLVVLLFHLDIPLFSAGYLGVDLFFVISGFIISRNILQDVHSGTFTLPAFYIRRFRRLFPALLVTVLATLLGALSLLPPAELEKTAEAVVYALFSLANIHFWLEAGYFDAAASTKPLLHTWSLSVEEQFYLFWPALLLFMATTQRRLWVTGLLLVSSLAAALYWRDAYPDAVFYQLPFRLHQLMAGALVALLALRLSAGLASMGTLCASVGFVICALLPAEVLSPAVGAVLVTGFGSLLLLGRESSLAQVVYGNQALLWVGKRSYALYLVHWPIVVLFKLGTDNELTGGEQALLLLLSLAAAVALHEWVEKPFRKRGEDTTVAQKMAMPAMTSLLLLTVIFAVTVWGFNGFPARIDPRIQALVDSIKGESELRRQAVRFGTCNLHKRHTFSDYDVGACATPDAQRKNVLIIGDSMAADTYMMLSQVYPEIHFLQATGGACTGILDEKYMGGRYPACLSLNDFRFGELLDRDLDLIILISIWTDSRIAPLKETVDYLQKRGQQVLVLGPRTVFRRAVSLLLADQNSFDEINTGLWQQVNHKTALLQRMRMAMPDAHIVDMAPIQCAPHCDVLEDDRLLYFDAQHFTQLGALRVGTRFRESVDLLGLLNNASTDTF